MKSNIEDVNKVFSEVHKELAQKASEERVTTHMEEQTLVNEALCSENCIGRWLWKSGDLGSGHCIPWEIQSVNTCPDNFVWERGRTSVVTVAPGLYEISVGIFSSSTPTVQVLVNGEPIVSAERVSSYNVSTTMARFDGPPTHSAGNVTGLTIYDFLALPTRARVSLSYVGDRSTEGFLGLRKL